MAKTILIQIKGDDKASAKIKKVEESVSNLGKKAAVSMKPAVKSIDDVQKSLNRMGNRFRFMTIAFGALAVGVIGLVKRFIESAKEMEAATLRVGVFAVSTGQSMEKAQKAALDLAQTGLVSVTEASNTLSNLLATGMNIDTATVLMKRMLDTAVLSKESLTDTFGRALEKSSLGIRILQERQVDAIGINFRADQVWRAYGKTIGKTTAEMSTQEKQMAIVNFLMKETERFSGGADLAMQTFGGTMSRLSTTVEIMNAKIGATLIPLTGALADVISAASIKLTEMAEEFPVLTSVMISGITVMVTVTAALAALGAIVPLVTAGVSGLSKAMLFTISKAGALFLAKFLAISAVIGGLIFLVLKATGQWDKWSNSMKNLAQKIKDTINPFKEQGDAISEATEKIRKQVEKLEKQVIITTRSFKEGMAEWAQKHGETIKNLKDQISDLQKEYSKATSRIRKDFSDTMLDLALSHSRKTEDMQRELAEEVSKGIWADQTRIRDIKLRLKRENEDYANSIKEKGEDRDEDLADEKNKLNTRLAKLQEDLDKELALEQKHAKMIAEARTWPILDEIEKRTRAYTERLEQYAEELKEIQKNSIEQVSSIDQINEAYGSLSEKIDEVGENALSMGDNISTSLESFKKDVNDANNEIERVGITARNSILASFQTLTQGFQEATGKLPSSFGQSAEIMSSWIPGSVKDFFSSFFKGSFAEGGIVPGSPTQPVPIIAHGSETVLPAGVAPITVNINNPTVRSGQDIMRIANAVKSVLSKQQALRHYK